MARKLMSIFRATDLSELPSFPQRRDQLALLERGEPQAAAAFFEKLMETSIRTVGKVRKEQAKADIKDILAEEIPAELQNDPFYEEWIADMADVSKSFCETQQSDAIGFCLSSERGCRRYHVDNVPLRALVTYAGKGTEYLPDEAANRRAFRTGKPNDKIIKDPSAIRFIDIWDVAVFRGGDKGLLHRTPDAALDKPSILMRLDHEEFWDNILRQKI